VRRAQLGWHLYPTLPQRRAACFKGAIDAATSDLDQLARWSREFSGCNWSVVFCPSRIWGLDCDAPPYHQHDGITAHAALVKVRGPIPPWPQARTGSGGLLLIFRHAGEAIVGESGHPALGIYPRRGRQSQTPLPSRHHRIGRGCRWINVPWEVPSGLPRKHADPLPVRRLRDDLIRWNRVGPEVPGRAGPFGITKFVGCNGP
jgi:hypothetical protein